MRACNATAVDQVDGAGLGLAQDIGGEGANLNDTDPLGYVKYVTRSIQGARNIGRGTGGIGVEVQGKRCRAAVINSQCGGINSDRITAAFKQGLQSLSDKFKRIVRLYHVGIGLVIHNQGPLVIGINGTASE